MSRGLLFSGHSLVVVVLVVVVVVVVDMAAANLETEEEKGNTPCAKNKPQYYQ